MRFIESFAPVSFVAILVIGILWVGAGLHFSL